MSEPIDSHKTQPHHVKSKTFFERLDTPTTVIAGFATILACVFAALALAAQILIPAFDLSQRDRAQAIQTREFFARRNAKPDLRIEFLVGASPNLTAQQDMAVLQRAGIQLALLRTKFRDQQESAWLAARDSDLRYLFVVIRNAGEIPANDIQLELDWRAKAKQALPSGVAYQGLFGPLKTESQRFALLIDAAPELEASKPLRASHVESICVTLTFANDFDVKHSERWCAAEDSLRTQSKSRPIGISNMGVK
jgi:hypothetical protein